jgi:uracil-DNA glycosylase
MTTPYLSHVFKWKDGCGSAECPGARKCFARGKIPCDILFIGEAPGPSEDVLGSPFVGPAGQLQDRIIEQAIAAAGKPSIRCAFGNLVCCIPRDDNGQKALEPSDEQVRQCQGRLLEFVQLCSPKIVVAVGKLAKDYLDQDYKHSCRIGREILQIHLVHPAAILRANTAQRDLMIRRSVIALENAIEILCIEVLPLSSKEHLP